MRVYGLGVVESSAHLHRRNGRRVPRIDHMFDDVSYETKNNQVRRGQKNFSDFFVLARIQEKTAGLKGSVSHAIRRNNKLNIFDKTCDMFYFCITL